MSAGRRLVVHAGLPKTGSSAVQAALWAARARLLEAGILYPEPVLAPDRPRQAFLHRELIEDRGFRDLRAALETAERTGARVLVLSNEGLSHQASLIDPARAAEMRGLIGDWTLELLFVLRDPAPWMLSKYRQNVLNAPLPRSRNPLERLYATGLPFERWARVEEVRRQADPEAIRARFGTLFPEAEIRFMDYGPGVVEAVFADLGAAPEGAEAEAGRGTEAETPKVNVTPPDPYVEVLRRVNALPGGGRMNAAARAAVARAAGEGHASLSRRRPARRAELLMLRAALAVLPWRPNPPLKVTRESFAAARRHVGATALRLAAGGGGDG